MSKKDVTTYKATTYVIISGFWNPLHPGHLALITEAKTLGDKVIVIVNNDLQVKLKGSRVFMNEDDRLKMIMALRDVDECCIAVDKDITVAETLEKLVCAKEQLSILTSIFGGGNHNEYIFAKGGDRKDNSCMPNSELDICNRLGIEIRYGVGGFDKKNSSSSILRNVT